MNRIDTFMKSLKSNRNVLTRQQLTTLRGQAIAGDINGAYEGLAAILRRTHGDCTAQN